MKNVRKTIGVYRYRKMSDAFVPANEQYKKHFPPLPPPEYIIKTLYNNYKNILKVTGGCVDKETIKKCTALAIELMMAATKDHLYYVRCHDYQLRMYHDYWKIVLDTLNFTDNSDVGL